jgi:YD repeat-containing protein
MFYHSVGLEFLYPNKLDAVTDTTDKGMKVTHRDWRAAGNLARMFDTGEHVTRKKTNRKAYAT